MKLTAYQNIADVVVRISTEEELSSLREYGILAVTSLDGIEVIPEDAVPVILGGMVEFAAKAETRVEYIKVRTDTDNFTRYVNLIPRDLKVCLYLIEELLSSDEREETERVRVKRHLIEKVSRLKNHVKDIDELEELLREIERRLYDINESQYLINRIKGWAATGSAFQPLLEVSRRFYEEIGESLITGADLPKHATDPALLNSEGDTDHGIAHKRNVLKEGDSDKTSQGVLFNIPTGRGDSSSSHKPIPSKLYGAKPFTMMVYRLEEFNTFKFGGDSKNVVMDPQNTETYPVHSTRPSSNPLGSGFPNQMEFLEKIGGASNGLANIGHEPTEKANSESPNPWRDDIREVMGFPEGFTGTAEGRPSGENGAHLAWKDGTIPETITSTSMAGAEGNTGFRDAGQLHSFSHGEFAPGGLYHRTMEAEDDLGNVTESIDGTNAGIPVKFHVNFPQQNKESLWTFDGTFPPKLLLARYGEPVILRLYNMLPIEPENNRGFGLHTISLHEHNGHNNSISDGFAQTYFFPGQYYDYVFLMNPSGYKTENLEKLDPRVAGPGDWVRDANGVPVVDQNKRVPGDNIRTSGSMNEIMSTHWMHDHMLDFTSKNVYKGNVATMNYYSSLDRGNEEIDDGVNLRLPSGTSLPWGNRDYDVYFMLMDKAWDEEGQLWFNPFNTNGFLGDRNLVNGVWAPYFKVRARRYRFRMLNASVSRWYKYALVRKRDDTKGEILGPALGGLVTWSYDLVPFHMIANDGNLMHHAVAFDGTRGTARATVPTQAIAERYDLVIDFGRFEPGDRLYFVNLLEHFNGKKPNRIVSVESVLNGSYAEKVERGEGDPCVEKFLEFRVFPYEGTDKSLPTEVYEFPGRALIPIKPIEEGDIRNCVQRRFDFINHISEDGTVLSDEWAIETDNDGTSQQMQPCLVSAAPTTNTGELWRLVNGGNGWAHNIHIHYTEGRILLRDNKLPPIWEQFSRKDVYRLGGVDGGDGSTDMFVHLNFKDNPGVYMMHCHNTMHEDHAMLLRWDIQEPSSVRQGVPTHLPTWDGVKFMGTFALPSFRSGIQRLNDEYVTPGSIVNRLKKLERNVPQLDSGEVFVDGLGKHLVNQTFPPREVITKFLREPLASGIRGTGGESGLSNSTSAGGGQQNAGESKAPEPLADSICTCSRESMSVGINGTLAENQWFNEANPDEGLSRPHIVKLKPGDRVTITATTMQEHGVILKHKNCAVKDTVLDGLSEEDQARFSSGDTTFGDVVAISNIWLEECDHLIVLSGDTPSGEWSIEQQIQGLSIFTSDVVSFGNPGGPTNNFGLPFRSKANGVIAEFKVAETAPETHGGTGGSVVCSVHGISMSFSFDICAE